MLLFFQLFLGQTRSDIDPGQPPLHLNYSQPARNWNEALPIGNGFISGMAYGTVDEERIDINEHTLWTGGPGEDPDYNGGHVGDPETQRATLQQIRQKLQDKQTYFALNNRPYYTNEGLYTSEWPDEDAELRGLITQLLGNTEHFGSYQAIGTLKIGHTSGTPIAYTQYTRNLDINRAIATVQYTTDDIIYYRDYFASYPHNAIIGDISNSPTTANLNRKFTLESLHKQVNLSGGGNMLRLQGKPENQSADGLIFEIILRVSVTGQFASITNDGKSITVNNCTGIHFVVVAGTNYRQSNNQWYNYFAEDLDLPVTLEARSSLALEGLQSDHTNDYTALFDRVKVNFNHCPGNPRKTTGDLIAGYQNGNTVAEDSYLEILYYQFGRYLLIASSRPGTLPANLQGIWGEGLSPLAGNNYHANVYLQMTYWPALSTNLIPCFTPYVNYINSLVPRGRETAKHYFAQVDGSDVRGFVFHTDNNVWGNTGPSANYTSFYFPAAAAWCAHDIYDRFLYTMDYDYLRRNWVTLLDAALFWVDNLWNDTYDGKLVANPSISQTHGHFEMGCSSDQSVIWQIFHDVVEAAGFLGIDDADVHQIEDVMGRISPPRVGFGDLFLEYKQEQRFDVTGDNGHPHLNYLFWLHPGNYIVMNRSANDNFYRPGIVQTLDQKGDGGPSWSKSWKIGIWARLNNGTRAQSIFSALLAQSTHINLLNDDENFQISGNMGATASITELFLQSQDRILHILPALPPSWVSGGFSGLLARGAFTVSAVWTSSIVTRIEIYSAAGITCRVHYPGISSYVFTGPFGTIDILDRTTDQATFDTEQGNTYTISIN